MVILVMLMAATTGTEVSARSTSPCAMNIVQPVLGDALTELARSCGVSLLYPSDLAQTRGLNPVQGRYSVPEALAIMLRGTSLTGKLTGRGVITISPPVTEGRRPVKTNSKSMTFARASAAALALMSTAQARAQAEKEEAPALETITVTARRSTEALVDVPLAVSALSAKAIEDRNITDIFQVAQFTPGFSFQNQAVGRNDRGFKQFVIRGIVPGSALATRQAATLFVDGAPVAGGNINGVNDIERIETIKGPQSAFFGRSTFAGAINFITRTPSYDWQGMASVQFERFGTIDANASIEGGIIRDKLSFRLAGRYYDTDGAYENTGWPGTRLGARQTKSLSLTVLAEPTENLRIRFFGSRWNDSDGLPANALLGEGQQNCTLPGNPANTLGSQRYICGKLPAAPASAINWGYNIDPIAYDAVQNGSTLYGPGFVDQLGLERLATQLRLLVDWELGDYTLSGIASYGKNQWGFLQTNLGLNLRSVPNPQFNGTTRPLRNQYNLVLGNTQDTDKYVELRLTTPTSSAIRGMIGVNYYDGVTRNLTSAYTATGGYSLLTPQTVNASDTYGVFGSATWDFAEGFSLSLEGRYQIDEIFQQTLAGAAPQFAQTYKSFTPRVILNYKPDDNSMIYASYSEGNRPGQFNTIFRTLNPVAQQQVLTATGGVAEAVPEDRLRMGEIGYKADLLDNRLRILIAAYYGKWSNRHIPNLVPYFDAIDAQGNPLPGEILRTVQLTNSNSRVELKGIEVEATWIVADGLTLDGTFAINDTKIEQTGCTDCLALTGNINPVGNQLPNYPKYAGTFSASYEHDLRDDMRGYVRSDVIYTGRQYDTESNLNYIGAAAVVNARIGVNFKSHTIELFSRNLFNNKTFTSHARGAQQVFNPDGSLLRNANGITVSLPEPVTYGIRAITRF
jgi:iron complex outermembrane receptor protein